MKLKQFAKKCGVEIVRCDKEWGGTYGYKEETHPNSTICGYRTENSTYNAWLRDTFGKKTARTIVNLLKKTDNT